MVEESTWEKARKSRSRFSTGMPMPVSLSSNMSWTGACTIPSATGASPSAVATWKGMRAWAASVVGDATRLARTPREMLPSFVNLIELQSRFRRT